MRLSSVVPDMGEILRGMSIADDAPDEFVSADDYYLQPQPHYVDNPRLPSNPLRTVSTARSSWSLRLSDCLSVPSIDSINGGRRVCC